MTARSILEALNHATLWHRIVPVDADRFRACSCDRLAYLWLQRLRGSRRPEVRLLTSLVRPGDHIVDAGANIGVFSHWLARAAGPSGRVTAFEPNPVLHAALVENVRLNGQPIRPLRFALGARSGTAQLACGLFNSGDNRLGHDDDQVVAQRLPVSVAALDDLMGQENVDLIKMDIQGWEVAALQGMARTIARNPGIRLYVEVWPYGLKRAGSSAQALLALLRSYDLELTGQPGEPPLDSVDFAAREENKFWFTDLVAQRRR